MHAPRPLKGMRGSAVSVEVRERNCIAMGTLLDGIVVADENREAFGRIVGITQKTDDAQVLLFMFGPHESGKTAVLRARGTTRDLLSTRSVIVTHAQELISAIKFGTSEKLLDGAGSADVLLLDDFDVFFGDDDFGLDVCRLLLTERNSKGLDTIIAARKPKAEYAFERLGDVLAAYEEVEVLPLGKQGRIEYARKAEEELRNQGESTVLLSPEARDFVANIFAQDIEEIRFAVQFLLTKAEFAEDDSEVTLEQAKEVLPLR